VTGRASIRSRRRFFGNLAALGMVAAASPLLAGCDRSGSAARVEPPPRVYRVGWLTDNTDPRGPRPSPQRFRERLTELGYVEGRNLTYEVRVAAQRDGLPELIADLVQARVDVILAEGQSMLPLLPRVPDRTAVVMVLGPPDSVSEGLAQSLAHPGGRFTGVTGGPLDLYSAKQLELFREAAPSATRVGVLWDSPGVGAPLSSDPWLRAVTTRAGELGLELHIVEVNSLDDIDGALGEMERANVEAFTGRFRLAWAVEFRRIVPLGLSHHLACIAGVKAWAMFGALVTYTIDFPETYARAAEYVDRILRGARPGELPIEHPSRFEVIVNLKTARELGLTIPPSALARATEVIQ
jgi:putative tryptophan/tyrosine transport system substrate-binding protein